MRSEFRLYMITRYLFVFYKTEQRVLEALNELMGDSDFWETWLTRYKELRSSKALQILMLRHYGRTYREIQKLVETSPTTIRDVIARYKLEYQSLPGIEKVEEQITELAKRLEEEGLIES